MSTTSYAATSLSTTSQIDEKHKHRGCVFAGLPSWAESGTSRNQNAKVDWCKVICQISLKLVSLSKPSSAEKSTNALVFLCVARDMGMGMEMGMIKNTVVNMWKKHVWSCLYFVFFNSWCKKNTKCSKKKSWNICGNLQPNFVGISPAVPHPTAEPHQVSSPE